MQTGRGQRPPGVTGRGWRAWMGPPSAPGLSELLSETGSHRAPKVQPCRPRTAGKSGLGEFPYYSLLGF